MSSVRKDEQSCSGDTTRGGGVTIGKLLVAKKRNNEEPSKSHYNGTVPSITLEEPSVMKIICKYERECMEDCDRFDEKLG